MRVGRNIGKPCGVSRPARKRILRHGLQLTLRVGAKVERGCGGLVRSMLCWQSVLCHRSFRQPAEVRREPRSVRACERTGVSKNQILTLAVAGLVENWEIIFYKHNVFVLLIWIGFKMWRMWWNYLKWMSPCEHATEDGRDALFSSSANDAAFDKAGASLGDASASGSAEYDAEKS